MQSRLPPNCYVVTTKNPKSLYALHTKTNTRIICFKEIHQASRCEQSLALYRNKYGKWPRRLIQNNTFNDIELKESERPPLSFCKNLLEIQYTDTKQILDMCNYFGIGLIMCEDYDIVHGSLHIKGTQIHDTQIDCENRKNLLESVYEES